MDRTTKDKLKARRLEHERDEYREELKGLRQSVQYLNNNFTLPDVHYHMEKREIEHERGGLFGAITRFFVGDRTEMIDVPVADSAARNEAQARSDQHKAALDSQMAEVERRLNEMPLLDGNSDEYEAERQRLTSKVRTLGENAGAELRAATARYEHQLAVQCVRELEQRSESLKEVKDGDDKALAKQLAGLQKKIDSFEKTVSHRQKHLQREITECQETLAGPVRAQLEAMLDNSVRVISTSDAQSAVQMTQIMRGEALKIGTRANAVIRDTITPLLRSIQSEQTGSGFELNLSGAPEYESFTELGGFLII